MVVGDAGNWERNQSGPKCAFVIKMEGPLSQRLSEVKSEEEFDYKTGSAAGKERISIGQKLTNDWTCQ